MVVAGTVVAVVVGVVVVLVDEVRSVTSAARSFQWINDVHPVAKTPILTVYWPGARPSVAHDVLNFRVWPAANDWLSQTRCSTLRPEAS